MTRYSEKGSLDQRRGNDICRCYNAALWVPSLSAANSATPARSPGPPLFTPDSILVLPAPLV